MASHASTSFAEVAYTNGYEFTQGSGYALPEYPFVTPPELASGTVGRYDIVIVGGGITGLTLACGLAKLGVAAVLLDEDNTVGVKGASSRGICYTQKSLEIFQRLGIYDRIAAKGIQWSVGRTVAGDDALKSLFVDLIGFAPGQPFAVHRVPFRIFRQIAELDQVEHVDRLVARQVLETLPIVAAGINIAGHYASSSL